MFKNGTRPKLKKIPQKKDPTPEENSNTNELQKLIQKSAAERRNHVKDSSSEEDNEEF